MRLARGFRQESRHAVWQTLSNEVFSPLPPSKARPVWLELMSKEQIRISGGIEKMRTTLFRIGLLSVSLLTAFGAASAQRRGHIDKWERKELRADRREVRVDTRDIRGDRRDI